MDISNPILTDAIGPPDILPYVENIEAAPAERKKQLAREFESLLIAKLLDQMDTATVGLGLDEDGSMSQVKSIFNFFLAQHIANNGGLGLWKQIYESITTAEPQSQGESGSIDKQV